MHSIDSRPPDDRTHPIKWLIAIAFLMAAASWILSYAGVVSATSKLPPIFFGVGLILILLHLVDAGDRRY